MAQLWLFEEEATLLASLKSMGNGITHGTHTLAKVPGSGVSGEISPEWLVNGGTNKRTEQKDI